MLAGIKDFFYRHRRKFITTGVVLGGSVVLLKIVQYKFRKFQERQVKEIADRFKRMQHFESTERTCNQTITGLSPTVSEKVLQDLDTLEILEKLRSNPDNKLELWEELRVLAFAKIVTLVYASSMLAVTLKAQINLLGGYLYKDTMESENKQVSIDIQTAYLSMIQYFMSDGLDKLMKRIRNNVEFVMRRYSLKQQLTLADTETLFWSIQMALNNDELSPTKSIAKFTLPQEENRSDILSKMYDETLDVLENTEVTDVCLWNVSNGFSLIVDKLAEYYAEADSKQAATSLEKSKSALNVDCLSNINDLKISLAKLIPIVDGLTRPVRIGIENIPGSLKGGGKPANRPIGIENIPDSLKGGEKPANGPNRLENRRGDMMSLLVARFMQSEKLKTFGTNVYETFCQ